MSEWNFDMSTAPRDGRAVLGLFEDHLASVGEAFDRYEVMEWDALEDEGWLHSNGFNEVDGHPIAWCPIPIRPSKAAQAKKDEQAK